MLRRERCLHASAPIGMPISPECICIKVKAACAGPCRAVSQPSGRSPKDLAMAVTTTLQTSSTETGFGHRVGDGLRCARVLEVIKATAPRFNHPRRRLSQSGQDGACQVKMSKCDPPGTAPLTSGLPGRVMLCGSRQTILRSLRGWRLPSDQVTDMHCGQGPKSVRKTCKKHVGMVVGMTCCPFS